MFKRIERKLERKAKEEELGIDEDMKEGLGIYDTDSDELESDSDESASGSGSSGSSSVDHETGSEAEEDTEDQPVLKKRKRDKHESEDENDEPSSDNESVAGQEDEVQLSVEEALNNPLYIVSIQPDIRACILCPGKVLKNIKMAEVHKDSQAHRRRFSRFQELAVKADPEDDARDILRRGQEANSQEPKDSKPSKRAVKRMEKLEKIKKIRKMKKAAKARAKEKNEKKAAASSDSSENRPMQKKIKVLQDVAKVRAGSEHSIPLSRSEAVEKALSYSSRTMTIQEILDERIHRRESSNI